MNVTSIADASPTDVVAAKPKREKHAYTIAARHKAKATPETGPIKISDRDGLYLRISVNGAKTWHLAYTFAGKQRTYRIGDYPMVDLDEAREIAHDRRKLIGSGIDPVAYDEQARIKNITANAATLWSVCESWLDHRQGVDFHRVLTHRFHLNLTHPETA